MKKTIRKESLYLLILWLASFLCLAFVLTSGYWSDDFNLWFMRGMLRANDQSIWDKVGEKILSHIARGRFFPVTSLFCESIVYLLPLKCYKLYLILLTLLCETAVFFALKELSQSAEFSFLAVFLSMTLFCVVPGYIHNVFLAFGGNAILSCLLCFTALFHFLRWVRKGKRKNELLFLGAFFLSLLTYEVAYTFFFVYLGVALLEGKGRIWRLVRKAFFLFLAVFLFYMYIKVFVATESYGGNSVALDVPQNLHGFFASVLAAFPFFSWIVYDGVSLPAFLQNLLPHIGIWILLAGLTAAAATLLLRAVRNKERAGGSLSAFPFWELIFVGTACIAFPAALMAVSKYQTLEWGLGYIVIVYQYFGYGILFALLFRCIFLRVPASRRKGTAVLLALSALVVLTVNQNNAYYNLSAMESSGRAGVLTAKQVHLIRSFVESDLFKELSREFTFLCTDDWERNALLNFTDASVTTAASAEEVNGTCRIRVFEDVIVVGETQEDSSVVKDPIFFYPEEAAGRKLIYSRGDKTAAADTLEEEGNREGAYLWMQRTGTDMNINSLKSSLQQAAEGTVLTYTEDDKQYRNAFLYGLSGAEGGFTWIEGTSALMVVQLTDVSRDAEALRLSVTLGSVINEEQSLTVLVNDTPVYAADSVKPGTLVSDSFPRTQDDVYVVTFRMEHAVVPASDSRTLSVGLSAVAFEASDETGK